MRYVLGLLLIAFLCALGVFAAQNTNPLTVRFMDWSATVPVALFTVLIYLLGTISGGSVVGFLRRSINRVSAESRAR